MSTPELGPLWASMITFCNLSVISLSVICKLPQIKAVFSSKSVKGLSVQGVMVELLGFSIVLGYNLIQAYPLFNFMEQLFLSTQDVILLIVIFHFMGILDPIKLGLIGLYIAVFYGFTLGIPHPGVLPFLMKFATPIFASSKILQLRAIWSSKNSDSVAVTTWLIACYTCVARLTTNMLLTGDMPLIINYTVGLILNLMVVGSALYFRRPNNQKESKPANSSQGKSQKKGKKRD